MPPEREKIFLTDEEGSDLLDDTLVLAGRGNVDFMARGAVTLWQNADGTFTAEGEIYPDDPETIEVPLTREQLASILPDLDLA